jgi:hypothetical protein
VRARLEVEPPRAWYHRISPNSRTLVILLQVDPASGDEPETVCEGCYEIKDTSIFAWFVGCVVRFVDYLPIARRTT